MLTIQNISLLNDIIRLPRESLQEISADLNLPTDCSVTEMAEKIWIGIYQNPELQNRVLDQHRHKILCGKTSVTWYSLPNGALNGAKQLIIENSGFNPFQVLNIPPADELTSTPVLISAAPGDSDAEYYLRFMYKSGVSRHFHGAQLDLRPNSGVKTVYVNEDTGCIEVRTDAKASGKFASNLASLIRQHITMTQINFLVPFGNDIERIADALGGELIDAVAKPELLLEDFTQDQANGVVSILSALDAFFEQEDIDVLQDSLQAARTIFGDEMLAIPFTALILNGLEKVGMGVTGRDLRGLPLYDFLKPHLQNQGGFIHFELPENGVMQSYTIRVGLKTNSIYFMTPATENAINHVREHIIIR